MTKSADCFCVLGLFLIVSTNFAIQIKLKALLVQSLFFNVVVSLVSVRNVL